MSLRSNRSKEMIASSSRNAAQVSSQAKTNSSRQRSRSLRSFRPKRTLPAPSASKTHRIRTVARKVRRRKRSEPQSQWANRLLTSLILMQSKRKRTRLHHSDEARKAVVIISPVLIRMMTLKTILRGRSPSHHSVTYQLLLSHRRPLLQPYKASKTSTIGTLTRWLMMRKKRNL